jgi:hypothetical protein
MGDVRSPFTVPSARVLAIGMAALLLAGCSGAPAILDCEPAHGLIPDCRFQNPEDLAASPSGRFILVSQFGTMTGGRPGSLAALEPESGNIEILFPAADAPAPPADSGWGDAACPPPPVASFSPHGIDLERLDSGHDALYVVNHGGRESIEMFEVTEDGERVALVWRGCVLAPEHGFFNDLVVLRNGDFRVSQMFPRGTNVIWTALRMMVTGYAPGYVYHWSPADGFRKLAGTDAKFANGVEKSPDERHLFVASYFGHEILKVDTERGAVVGRASVKSPDNLTWSPTGELLAASHHASIADTLACQRLEQGSCGFGFQIVAVDPDTMATRVLLEHEGPPMGAATVALPFGDAVYLGTFAGDRIARAPASILER